MNPVEYWGQVLHGYSMCTRCVLSMGTPAFARGRFAGARGHQAETSVHERAGEPSHVCTGTGPSRAATSTPGPRSVLPRSAPAAVR